VALAYKPREAQWARHPAPEAYDRQSLVGGSVLGKCSAVPPAAADRPGSWLPRPARRPPPRPDLLESAAGLVAPAAAACDSAVLAESWALAVAAVQAEQPRCPPAARPSFSLGVRTESAWGPEAVADPIQVPRAGLGCLPEVATAAERGAPAPGSADSSVTPPALAAALPASAASAAPAPASAEPAEGPRTHSDARRPVAAGGRRSPETAGWWSLQPRQHER
jgi:hypothetical protein